MMKRPKYISINKRYRGMEIFTEINKIAKRKMVETNNESVDTWEFEEFVEIIQGEKKSHRIFCISTKSADLSEQFSKYHGKFPDDVSQSTFTGFDLTDEDHEFLLKKKYKKVEEKWVMFVNPKTTEFDFQLPTNYQVQEIKREDSLSDDYRELASLCFPQYHSEEGTWDNFINGWASQNNNSYFSINNNSKAIGLGILTVEDDSKIQLANLSFAAVHPDHQGQGIFKFLIRKRVEKAKSLGMKLVTVYGLSNTSGPILLKMGFERAQIMSSYFVKNTE